MESLVDMLSISKLKKYYNGKKVFVTGHTGFKGSYLCVLLKYLGAKVYGYSLKPEKNGLYELLSIGAKGKLVYKETFADIRDYQKLKSDLKKAKPDYIIHMAAQPLVLLSYEEPRYTYEVNVMGTVNLMEAIREVFDKTKSAPISILNVTTDKVYENNDLSNYAFKENDKLCGRDPYANSKSCSEIVTYAYNKSFFTNKSVYRVSTARAGNVIGGGDLNKDRIIPDCYRAIKNNKEMFVRNPQSIRPYQYVLEPLILYLNIMAYQKENAKYEGNYNIGPDKKSCLTTRELTGEFFTAVSEIFNEEAKDSKLKNKKCPNVVLNKNHKDNKKHEAAFLRLDNKLIKKTFAYKEIFNMKETMKWTAKVYMDMLVAKNLFNSINEVIKSIDV